MSLETLRMRPDDKDPLPVPKPSDPPPNTNSGGTCTALDRQADPGDEPTRPKPEKLRTIAVASRQRMRL